MKTPPPWEDDSIAPNGRPVRDNFADWFAQSKVVDESGRPLVVYHGTRSEFDTFSVSDRGTFGAGIYFGTSPEQAAEFALDGSVIAVHVSIQNPFYTRADYDQGERHDLDSPALGLIIGVFGDEADEVIRRLRNAQDCHLDSAIRDRLLELGHDGIVATYSDGTAEVIAFFPEQVKSATDNSGDYARDNPSMTDRHSEIERKQVENRERCMSN